MSIIQSTCGISHLNSGLSMNSRSARNSSESAFVASVVEVGAVAESIHTGDVVTPHSIGITLQSGDPVLIGLSDSVFPFRVALDSEGRGESCLLRLDFESKREISEVTAEADEPAKRLAGTYFDLGDRNGTVRVWFSTEKESSSVAIASLSANGGIGGKYIDLRDDSNAPVRVWVNVNNLSSPPAFPSGGALIEVDFTLPTAATGTITYGTPGILPPAGYATGTLVFSNIPSHGDTVTIGGTTYTFQDKPRFTVVLNAASNITQGGYFDLTLGGVTHRFWYDKNNDGTGAPLVPSGGFRYEVDIATGDTADQVRSKTQQAIDIANIFDTAAPGGATLYVYARIFGSLSASTGIGTAAGSISIYQSGITAANIIAIETDITAQRDNLIAAINGTAGFYTAATVAHTGVTASAGALDTMIVTAIAGGSAGESIAIAESGAGTEWLDGATTLSLVVGGMSVTVDGATFVWVESDPVGGEFSSIAELAALIDALQNVSATVSGGDVIVTASTAGEAGNSITMATTGTTGLTLSGATLEGGVDGDGTEESLLTAIAEAIDAHPGLDAEVSGSTVVITNSSEGPRANISSSSPDNLAVSVLVDSTPAPAAPTAPSRLLQVSVAANSPSVTVASALAAALNADSEFTAAVSADKVTVTSQHTGVRSNIVNGAGAASTGFSLATVQEGSAMDSVWIKSTGTSTVLVAVAPN